MALARIVTCWQEGGTGFKTRIPLLFFLASSRLGQAGWYRPLRQRGI
jgi:hypothetical protein